MPLNTSSVSIPISSSSNRIKKPYFFTTLTATVFYVCDLPLGYRIPRNSKQRLGQIICILQSENKIYKCQLSSIPHLNSMQEWNENYFQRVINGMKEIMIVNEDDEDDDNLVMKKKEKKERKDLKNNQNTNDIESDSQFLGGNKISTKTALVKDLSQTQEQVYLLRCKLYQTDFHISPANKLWQLFQKYNKFKKRQQITIIKQISLLNQQKLKNIVNVNKLYDEVEKEKNIIRGKLSALFNEKVKKLKEFDEKAQEKVQMLRVGNGRGWDQNSSNAGQGDYSQVDSLFNIGSIQGYINSQDERVISGSLFDPSQYQLKIKEQHIQNEKKKEPLKQNQYIELEE